MWLTKLVDHLNPSFWEAISILNKQPKIEKHDFATGQVTTVSMYEAVRQMQIDRGIYDLTDGYIGFLVDIERTGGYVSADNRYFFKVPKKSEPATPETPPEPTTPEATNMSVFPENTVEAAIERKYMATLLELGFGNTEANEAFVGFIQQTEGQDAAPNGGDRLLDFAQTDDRARAVVERLRNSGVRDEDIRSWYNMHPLERTCLVGIMEILIASDWMEGLKRGKEPDDATINTFRLFPRFGDPADEQWGGAVQSKLTADDRPLPIELFNVISDFLAVKQCDPAFAARRSAATSLNVLIREAMRTGELHRVAAELTPLEPTTPEPTLSDAWWLKSEDGTDYGPVTKAELDQWLQEGRISEDAQILQEGASQWRWASDIYPERNIREAAPETPEPLDAKLTTCPDCEHMVSRRANSCPSCGAPLTPTRG